ncbi:MAG: cyclic lactone autoinducer peptide [Enterococcus sp.]|nr:cyclic lactone autoinducer peptide [Enterococcus sp.]
MKKLLINLFIQFGNLSLTNCCLGFNYEIEIPEKLKTESISS